MFAFIMFVIACAIAFELSLFFGIIDILIGFGLVFGAASAIACIAVVMFTSLIVYAMFDAYKHH